MIPVAHLVGASVPGTRHTSPGKPIWCNNQDSWKFGYSRSGASIGLISDGCSSGRYSEVGAILALNRLFLLLSESMNIRRLPSEPFPLQDINWTGIQNNLVSFLRGVAWGMSNDAYTSLSECFLFTLVGMIITPSEICTFHIGDGVILINDEVIDLGKNVKNNAPCYLMYQVTGSSAYTPDSHEMNFSYQIYPRGDVYQLAIGCDGVLDLLKIEGKFFPGTTETIPSLHQILADPMIYQNPDYLRRYLARINRDTAEGNRIVPGLLPDDTTLIAARL